MRRHHTRRNAIGLLGLFVAVTSFVFLTQQKTVHESSALDLTKFDPGNIISDYVMTNYESMTEAEIQAFLTAKNPCGNKDRALYDTMVKTYPNVKWHWEEDHFVCISEELFGDGMEIGKGETAAKIITDVAKKYKINPQVLLVLIEKESGLITDTYPNDLNYRTMTGFGCPDTAPCDAKYFGFKNQIEKAAWLFREVLDGGWTNYPLGENYIQYNPNASCGGSIVSIKNLSTSALYRYTPYQPNAAALAAGRGTATCGAYGNRNFYIYFMDWFGNPTLTNDYVRLDEPRYFEITKDTIRVNPYTQEEVDTLKQGTQLKMIEKIFVNNEWCYKTEYNTTHNLDYCVLASALKEIELKYEDIPVKDQYMTIKAGSFKQFIVGQEPTTTKLEVDTTRKFTKKTTFMGKVYYISEYDEKNSKSRIGILSENIAPKPEYEELPAPRYMEISKKAERFNPITGEKYDTIEAGRIIKFSTKITVDGVLYYRTEHNTLNKLEYAIASTNIKEIGYEPFLNPRYMHVKQNIKSIDPASNVEGEAVAKDTDYNFTQKLFFNNEWYYRTSEKDGNITFRAKDVSEIAYEKLEKPIKITLIEQTKRIDPVMGTYYDTLEANKTLDITSKITINGNIYYRTKHNTEHNINAAIPSASVKVLE